MSPNGATQLVGVMGWPVSHSKSPAMHSAAFAALGLNWAYLPLPVHTDAQSVQAAVFGLRALGFKGANVTVPHKTSVLPFMDSLSPGARAIGAVNTICVMESGELVGHNTDAFGFVADLREHGIDPSHSKALLLGAGGSARAVLYGLLEAGCSDVCVVNRSLDKAQNLIADMSQHFSASALSALELSDESLRAHQSATLVVNCTPFGMGERLGQMAWRESIPFRPDQSVYDLVYNPSPTALLLKAKQDGARAIDGLGMLVHQGAISFELWTGHKAPVQIMRDAIS